MAGVNNDFDDIAERLGGLAIDRDAALRRARAAVTEANERFQRATRDATALYGSTDRAAKKAVNQRKNIALADKIRAAKLVKQLEEGGALPPPAAPEVKEELAERLEAVADDISDAQIELRRIGGNELVAAAERQVEIRLGKVPVRGSLAERVRYAERRLAILREALARQARRQNNAENERLEAERRAAEDERARLAAREDLDDALDADEARREREQQVNGAEDRGFARNLLNLFGAGRGDGDGDDAVGRAALAEAADDEESEIDGDAAADDDEQSAASEIDADLDVRVAISNAARFPLADAPEAERGLSARDFLNRVFGADEANRALWGTEDGGPDELVFVLKRVDQEAVMWFVERLFRPIIDHWAKAGADGAVIGRRPESLWTYYWINSVVPLATAVALEMRRRRVLSDGDRAEEQVNQQLKNGIDLLRELVLFIIVKAATGNESSFGGVDGEDTLVNDQTEHARAGSMFDSIDAYRANPTIADWLGERAPDARTRNQLLSFDSPLQDNQRPARDIAEFLADPERDPAEAKALVSTPLIKMAFTLQRAHEAAGVTSVYAENGARLFPARTEDGGGGALAVGVVDFVKLATDRPPVLGSRANATKNQNSLQSLESRIARIFALPLLDALFIDEMGAYGIRPEEQMLQDVGAGLDAPDYVNQLGLLGAFTQAKNARDEETGEDVRIETDSFKRVLAATGERITTEQERVFVGVFDGNSANRRDAAERVQPIALRGDEQRLDLTEEPPETAATPDDIRSFSILALPALLNQIANLDNVWAPNPRTNKLYKATRNPRLRFIVAHRIVGSVFFTDVAFGAAEARRAVDDADTSFFSRYGIRPSIDVPGRPERFLQSAARRQTARSDLSLQGVRRAANFRFGLKKLSAAIAKDARKGQLIAFNDFAAKEFDGALAKELDSPNEPKRTVLVPTDQAIDEYMDSAVFRVAVARLDEREINEYLYKVFQYHILDREIDFKQMRKERAASKLPTELSEIDSRGRKKQLRMSVFVDAYDTQRGGSLTLNGQRGFTVSALRLAKNGNYAIIDRVVDPERVKREQLGTSAPSTGNDDDDDDGSLTDSVSDGGDSSDERTKRVLEREAVEAAGFERGFVAPPPPTTKLPPPFSGAKALRARSEQLAARQATRNERDFAPFERLMAASGADADLRQARASGEHCAVLAPTPQALADAGLSPTALGELSDAELARVDGLRAFCAAHVVRAAYATDADPERMLRGPLAPQDLIHIMGKQSVSKMATLDSATELTHVPYAKRKLPTKPAHKHAQVHLDELELHRSPAYTYRDDSDVYVHFVSRALVPAPVLKSAAAKKGATKSAAPAARKSAAPPARKSTGIVPDRLKKSAATKKSTVQSAAKKSAVQSAVKTSAVHAGASSWSDAVAATAAELRKSASGAAYADVVHSFGAQIKALGGAKTLASSVGAAEISASFGKLRQAIARNQNVKIGHKAVAHDALEKLGARFPTA